MVLVRKDPEAELKALSLVSLVPFADVVSESTGIVLNNEMDDFSSPGFANVYGIAPSKANFIKPGRRPVSSMVPTIITDKLGDVKLIVGAAGGPKIITSTAFVSYKPVRHVQKSISS